MDLHARTVVLGLSLSWLALGCGPTVIGGNGGNGGGGGSGGSTTHQNEGICPKHLPLDEACKHPDDVCEYDVYGCAVTVLCSESTWVLDPAHADDCTVECGPGAEDHFCATPYEECKVGDECGGQMWTCDSDHLWYQSYYDVFCCLSTPSPCPETAPSPGDSCDPCSDSSSCVYQVPGTCADTLTMGCQPATASWEEVCP